jgi:glycosyltransferase involved in cell wall biosynthesis
MPPYNKLKRIGIWCDYGFTLSPAQGIGVLVHNLARGLIEADDGLEVVLLICPKDPEDYGELVDIGQGRIKLFPERWPGRHAPLWKKALRRWLDGSQACYDLHRLALDRASEAQSTARSWLQMALMTNWTAARQGRPVVLMIVALFLLLMPLVFLIGWCGYTISQLFLFLLKVLLFPALVFDRVLRRLTAVCHDPAQNTAAAGCDVWIIPWINLDTPLPTPSVLLIHDLVHEHFPDAFEDVAQVVRLRLLAPRRAAEATLCACMSSFIRDTDLLGVLQLPPSKVRLLPLAMPGELADLSDDEASRLRPPRLRRPYLFYPAGFRPYKNHRILIEALHILRADHDERRFDLVLTGYADLPAELLQLVHEFNLQDRVHVLDTVDRATLAALYRGAFATLAPSLYEQGSFPIFEALHYGCPVACSRIPSFVEQCCALGEAMLYFDPLDAESVAQCVLAIRDDREGVRNRQREASQALRTTTWRGIADAWLAVLQEAIEEGAARGKDSSRLERRLCA